MRRSWFSAGGTYALHAPLPPEGWRGRIFGSGPSVSDRPFRMQRRDLVLAVTKPVEDLVGVLAEQWRPLHLDRRVGELDRRAELDVLAARRMIELDQKAALVKRLVL